MYYPALPHGHGEKSFTKEKMGENINVLAENVLTVNLSSTVKDTTSENEALQLDICAYKERNGMVCLFRKVMFPVEWPIT